MNRIADFIRNLPLRYNSDKFNLFLAIIWVKPVSIIEIDTEKLNSLIFELKKLPIKFFVWKKRVNPENNDSSEKSYIHNVYVWKDEKDLSFFKNENVIKNTASDEDKKSSWLLLWYPITAIEWYINNNCKDVIDMKKYLRENWFSPLVWNIIFSKDNWKIELIEIQKWQNILEQYFPEFK